MCAEIQYLRVRPFFMEALGFRSTLLHNVAYAASIEVSIICGFVLHSFYSWSYRFKNFQNLLRKFVLFQGITALSFTVRQALFYVLLQAGINYRINTLIGIGVAVTLNFLGYQKVVFASNKGR